MGFERLCKALAELTIDDASATLDQDRDIGEPLSSRQENEMYRHLVADNIAHPALRESERALIMNALRRNAFNKAETARRLGISRTTLWRKLKAADVVE